MCVCINLFCCTTLIHYQSFYSSTNVQVIIFKKNNVKIYNHLCIRWWIKNFDNIDACYECEKILIHCSIFLIIRLFIIYLCVKNIGQSVCGRVALTHFQLDVWDPKSSARLVCHLSRKVVTPVYIPHPAR
jgi:hypothetical protein